jgi:1-acyl-sn-glycerol-3-phosphate acyltransferase
MLLMRFFWSIYVWITGWKIHKNFPYHLDKCVLIVAPHTSAWDFIVGLAIRSVRHLEHVKYLGKDSLFKGPFAFIFKSTGGFPVDRFNKHNMVDQVVQLFNSHEKFVLALSPEGTRKKTERLRTGFYHIAKNAGVPIVMIGLDFGKKEVTFAEPFYTTHNEAEDFKKIISFFAPLQGKIPEYGMSHLTDTYANNNA